MSKGSHSKGVEVVGISDNNPNQTRAGKEPERLIGVEGISEGEIHYVWMTPKRTKKVIKQLQDALAAVEAGLDYNQ